jgi:hypothetical protein
MKKQPVKYRELFAFLQEKLEYVLAVQHMLVATLRALARH